METDFEALDVFGQFLIENLRDQALAFYDNLLAHSNWHPALQVKLREAFSPWSADQQKLVEQCIGLALDSAIHDFLFKLHMVADNSIDGSNEHTIQILVDGKDVTGLSDALQREAYGESGWITKYSKFKSFDAEP